MELIRCHITQSPTWANWLWNWTQRTHKSRSKTLRLARTTSPPILASITKWTSIYCSLFSTRLGQISPLAHRIKPRLALPRTRAPSTSHPRRACSLPSSEPPATQPVRAAAASSAPKWIWTPSMWPLQPVPKTTPTAASSSAPPQTSENSQAFSTASDKAASNWASIIGSRMPTARKQLGHRTFTLRIAVPSRRRNSRSEPRKECSTPRRIEWGDRTLRMFARGRRISR